MVQTVLVLLLLTGGSLWFTGRRPGRTGRRRPALELGSPQVYGVLFIITVILVWIWK